MNFWQLKKNCAADKHSPIGGWNVESLHYSWIVMRQLVGHQQQESTIVYFVEEDGSPV